MKAAAKLLTLLLLAVVLFLGNAYGSMSFAGLLFPRVDPRPYIEMISAAAVGALAGGLLVAYPLARLFPSRYLVAALLVSAPLMALRLSDLLTYANTDHVAIITMSALELILAPVGAAIVTWLFAKFYPRESPHVA
jgi:hypothetical protein